MAISPPEGYMFRPLLATDVGTVARLVGDAMNADEGAQAASTLQSHFDCFEKGVNDGRSLFVLCQKEYIAAVAGLHFYAWGPRENVWLSWFAVDPSLQRKGLGKWMIERMEDHARQCCYQALFIETYSTPDFESARNFYYARGYGMAGGIKGYLPCGGDMVVYSKTL